jgi:hypothetical protein
MNSQNFPEAKLAWVIWQALEKLNSLLWDRYQKDFLSLATENEKLDHPSTDSDTEPIDESFPQDTTSSGT